jgi:RimJ/RimL family protein N-acetyltransferase
MPTTSVATTLADVQLRPVTEEDLPHFFEHQLDLEANRMAVFTSEDPSDREAFLAKWRKVLADPTAVARTILVSDEVAGHVVCHRWFGEPEVCYWLAREVWGRGVATEALRLLLEEVTDRPLHARVAASNGASRRVLEKCGFVASTAPQEVSNVHGETVLEVALVLA